MPTKKSVKVAAPRCIYPAFVAFQVQSDGHIIVRIFSAFNLNPISVSGQWPVVQEPLRIHGYINMRMLRAVAASMPRTCKERQNRG